MKKTKDLIRPLAYLMATWFGSGRARIMPGTIGSLMTLPFVALMIGMGGLPALVGFIALTYLVGLWAVRHVLKETEHDPGFVVIDEVVGQALTFVFVSYAMPSWWMFLVGFAAFRFFDIVKLWPACYFDTKVRNASGVMLDDVVAGGYAAVVLLLLQMMS